MKDAVQVIMICIVVIIICISSVFGGWQIKRWFNYKFSYGTQVERIVRPLEKRIAKLEQRVDRLEKRQADKNNLTEIKSRGSDSRR